MSPLNFRKNKSEASFTLLETIIAMAILTTVILELVKAQGNVVYFSSYTRRITEGSWLAKRIMSQVEYQWARKPFKEMETEEKGKSFEESDPGYDYTYNLTIHDWKFPFLDMLTGGGAAGGGEEGGDEGGAAAGGAGMIQEMLEQVLGKDPLLKIARVEVFWPEGAKQNSVDLTMLLTNQRKIDEELMKLEPAAKKLEDQRRKAEEQKNKPPKTDPDKTDDGEPPP